MRNRVIRALLILVLIVALCSSCSGNSKGSLNNIIDSNEVFLDSNDFCQRNLDQVIIELTSPEYEGRKPGSEGNKLATEYIVERFKELGLTPAGENDTYLQIVAPGLTKEPDDEKNVIGLIEGKNSDLSPIIFSAHFDHLGMKGSDIYPGALDNASGVAFILELARVLKKAGPFDRDIYFISFNTEEAGLLGSDYFVKNPTFDTNKAECLNFDMIGTANENVLLYLLYSSDKNQLAYEIRKHSKLVDSTVAVHQSERSDHAPFCHEGIDAVSFIYYDTENYHKTSDTFENMDTGNIEDVFILVKEYLGSRGIVIESEFKFND